MSLTIDTNFIERLSSKEPTPGGGATAAYCGALAGACASFVGNLTIDNKKYAEVKTQVEASVNRLNETTADLIYLVDEDANAFAPVAKAMKLPKGELRDREIDKCLVGACEIPLEIMQKIMDILDECTSLAEHGSRLALSDVGCAAAIGRGALIAASMNIYANAKMFRQEDKAIMYKNLATELCDDGVALADSVLELVNAEFDSWVPHYLR